MEKIIVEEKSRLDKILSLKLNSPRNQVEKLIKDGNVKVNSKIQVKCGLKLNVSDSIEVTFPEIVEEIKKEVNFDIEIIYEDDDI